MRFKDTSVYPEAGTLRRREVFLWFPTTVIDHDGSDITVWLEKVEVEEEYRTNGGDTGTFRFWYPLRYFLKK